MINEKHVSLHSLHNIFLDFLTPTTEKKGGLGGGVNCVLQAVHLLRLQLAVKRKISPELVGSHGNGTSSISPKICLSKTFDMHIRKRTRGSATS